jgi:hypothetical protein
MINYDELFNIAKISLIRNALKYVQKNGLEGETHFYITFKTGMRGVKIPEFLRAKYPNEMTIVLQHSFSDLTVSETDFGVNLSFGGHPFYIVIPFNTIVEFKDPSAGFILGINPYETEINNPEEPAVQNLPIEESAIDDSNIIDFSKFRK